MKKANHQDPAALDAEATSAADMQRLSDDRKVINDIPAQFPWLDQTAAGDLVEFLNELIDKMEENPNFQPHDEYFKKRFAQMVNSYPEFDINNVLQ
jgi:hypothetical protein